jgi:PAS domain S-box-containing protein
MNHPDLVSESAAADGATELYRQIADTIPQMVWTARADGGIDYVNARVLEYTGQPRQSHYGWGWKGVIHREDLENCVAVWTRSLQSGERYEIEYRLRRADGAWRWHHGSALPLRSTDGRILHWFGVCTDIEDQVRSTQALEALVEERTRALKASEQRFQLFMDALPAPAWIRGQDFRYLWVNRAFCHMWATNMDEVVGAEAFRRFTLQEAQRYREIDDEVRSAGRPLEFVDKTANGHWLKVKFPLADASGNVAIGGIAIDISARIQAEETAQRYAGQARSLLNQLVGAREAERRRLADDLHDLIGQNLTALGIELAALRRLLPAPGRDVVAGRLDAMAGLVNDTVESIRGVMSELRPAALEAFGLVPALRAHAAAFAERTGLNVSVNAPGAIPRLAGEAELALFRIAQEALTNAAKHSGCTSVDIVVTESPGLLRLSVHDDGSGFTDPVGARGARRGGYGLPEMRERAEAHGGKLRIEFPGRGTRLVAELPGGNGH